MNFDNWNTVMLELANRRDRRSEERGVRAIQSLSVPPRSRPLALSSLSPDPTPDRTVAVVRPAAAAPSLARPPEEIAAPPAPGLRRRLLARIGVVAIGVALVVIAGASFGLIDSRDTATPEAPSVAVAPAAEAPEPASPQPPDRATVKEVQRLLARLGYDPGPFDGIAGPQTRLAIAAYLRARNPGPPAEPTAAMLHALRWELAAVTGGL